MANHNLYNYPFQEIDAFLNSDFDLRLEKFYASFQNNEFGHRIKQIDKNSKIVQLFKDSYLLGESDYQTFSFDREITTELGNLIFRSFDLIEEGLRICFMSKQPEHIYLEKLERQFEGLVNNKINKVFPSFGEKLKFIGVELERYKRIDNVQSSNASFKQSPFKPKETVRRKFFLQLYDLALNHELVEDTFPKESFVEVFTSPVTDAQISFSCNNSLAITFFEGIRPAFEKLNSTTIEKSGRFLTKQAKNFSTSIYDTSKNRMAKSPSVSELAEDLKDLMSH